MEIVTLTLSIISAKNTAMALAGLVMGINTAYMVQSNSPVMMALTVVILVFALLCLTSLRGNQENKEQAGGEENTKDKKYHWESAGLALVLLMSLWSIYT